MLDADEQFESWLSERMISRFEDVYAYAKKNLLTMRQATMDIVVSRVVDGNSKRFSAVSNGFYAPNCASNDYEG